MSGRVTLRNARSKRRMRVSEKYAYGCVESQNTREVVGDPSPESIMGDQAGGEG